MADLLGEQEDRMIQEFGCAPTKEELLEKILLSQQKMLSVLAGAWDHAPEDKEVRVMILKAMKKAMKLREETKKAFSVQSED